jgi:hypothetical protein
LIDRGDSAFLFLRCSCSNRESPPALVAREAILS